MPEMPGDFEFPGFQEGVKAADPGGAGLALLLRDGRHHQGPGKLDLLGLLGGYGKPLWITEIDRRDGSRGGIEQEQASYLGRTAAQMATRPDVGAFFVYELFDEPYFGATNPESHYGLVELAQGAGGTWRVARKKAAFDAYRAAIRAAGTRARLP